MLLSVRPLKDCTGVNSFEYSEVFEFSQGDVVDCYFQLIDASLDTSVQNFLPPGRRYMPTTGASVQITVDSIDDLKKITRSAVQPFAQDPSIWKLSFISSDIISGTANMRIVLTETGPKVTRGLLKNAFRIQSNSNC